MSNNDDPVRRKLLEDAAHSERLAEYDAEREKYPPKPAPPELEGGLIAPDGALERLQKACDEAWEANVQAPPEKCPSRSGGIACQGTLGHAGEHYARGPGSLDHWLDAPPHETANPTAIRAALGLPPLKAPPEDVLEWQARIARCSLMRLPAPPDKPVGERCRGCGKGGLVAYWQTQKGPMCGPCHAPPEKEPLRMMVKDCSVCRCRYQAMAWGDKEFRRGRHGEPEPENDRCNWCQDVTTPSGGGAQGQMGTTDRTFAEYKGARYLAIGTCLKCGEPRGTRHDCPAEPVSGTDDTKPVGHPDHFRSNTKWYTQEGFERLVTRYHRMAQMLKKLEWCGRDQDGKSGCLVSCCPQCGAEQFDGAGHQPGCEFATILCDFP